ncbi:MAG: glycosyltransferase family 4 protein [Thermincola sp.]|nr:glycosyltransferase family 4 protein [Thermincola sp.]
MTCLIQKDLRDGFLDMGEKAMVFYSRLKGFIKKSLKKYLIGSGQFLGSLWPVPDSSLYFFFPVYHIGGAEKVHADIVACVADQNPIVFFTNKSINQNFKFLFEGKGKLFDISKLIENRIFSLICLGIIAKIINKHPYPVVFGSNSAFYYRIIPYLHSRVYKIDLIHAFGGGVEFVSLQVVPYLEARVVINTKTLKDIIEQYASNGLDSKLINKVFLIENQTIVPDRYPEKHEGGPLRVLYIGRGTEEKRVHLIGRAAAECYQKGIPATFTFVGDVHDSVKFECREFCFFAGEIWEPDRLSDFYRNADILVLASSREGFPMVIMEAMAHGVVPITTKVGGIPDHVKHGLNGMLISDESESEVVDSLVLIIDNLNKNRKLLRELSYSAYKYADENFRPSSFNAAYRKLLVKQPRDQKGDEIYVT